MIKINSITEVKEHLGGLKAVIFDLDDTLYSEKEYVRSGFKAVASVLSNVDNVEQKLWTFFEDGKQAIDGLLELEGLDSDEMKQKCLFAYRTHIPDIRLYDGAADLLFSLRKEGYMLGIITDGRPDGQRAKIRALGLEALVDVIIITDELGGVEFRKPCTQAFTVMHDKLSELLGQSIDYPEMCYIGDNTAKDFIAPEALGMRSIWFDNEDGIYT